MNYVAAILNIIALLVVMVVFYRKYGNGQQKLYWSALVVHIVAGFLMGAVYIYYYNLGDTWSFFYEAAGLADQARHNFNEYLATLAGSHNSNFFGELVMAEWRSSVFVKLLSMVCLVTNGNYWLCSVYLSFASFTMAWLLFTNIVRFFNQSTVSAAVAFLFFPSVVFWSSGIEKETVALGALYFVSSIFILIMKDQRVTLSKWMGTIACLLLAWSLKYYWVAVILPVMITCWSVKTVTKKYPITPIQILVLGIFFLAILTAAVSVLHPNIHYDAILQVVVANNHEFNSISNSESIIHYYQLQPTVLSVLINAPWALLSGLFRPVIGETQSLMGIAASCENLVIMILFISSVYGVAKNKQSPSILVLSIIVFIVILCIFLALSTPNLGTLSRYRVGFLPFFIFLITYQNPLVAWIVKHSPFSRK